MSGKAKKQYDYEEGIVSETGKWNTSKEYSALMIMKPLYECSEFETICYHGSSELIDDFVITPEDKIKARIFALERYITTLKKLITNVVEQFQKPENKKKIYFFKMQINLLYNSFPMVKILKRNQTMQGDYDWIEINEKVFNFILDEVITLREKISGLLTDENLVYYNIEEFDMDKAKEEFMKKFVEEG